MGSPLYVVDKDGRRGRTVCREQTKPIFLENMFVNVTTGTPFSYAKTKVLKFPRKNVESNLTLFIQGGPTMRFPDNEMIRALLSKNPSTYVGGVFSQITYAGGGFKICFRANKIYPRRHFSEPVSNKGLKGSRLLPPMLLGIAYLGELRKGIMCFA